MKFQDITKEQAEQLRGCKSYEEFMAGADKIGLEVDEDLSKVVRGAFDDPKGFKAFVEGISAKADDEDISEDELKAIAGGGDRDVIYWEMIADAASPARVRSELIGICMKYNLLFF